MIGVKHVIKSAATIISVKENRLESLQEVYKD